MDEWTDYVVVTLLRRNEYLDAQVERAEYEADVMKKLDSWIVERGAHA